jgi:hypothetical protein
MPTTSEPLIARDAAERLGMPIKDLLRLALHRRIRYVMVDGIPHFPEEALDEFQGGSAG